MSKVNDGGPFHPMPGEVRRFDDGDGRMDEIKTPDYAGISLRDWFAGMAMQGMIAGRFSPPYLEGVDVQDALGQCAYLYADGMIEARGK